MSLDGCPLSNLFLVVSEAGWSGIPSPFPCRPAIREWLWKKIQIEKNKDTEAKSVVNF